MPQIMPQCYRLNQIFIQPERLRNGSRILRYFKRMCQPRPVMISHRCEKNLRLTFQSPERLTVQDTVTIPLKDRTNITLRFLPVSALCVYGQTGVRT